MKVSTHGMQKLRKPNRKEKHTQNKNQSKQNENIQTQAIIDENTKKINQIKQKQSKCMPFNLNLLTKTSEI